MNQVVKSMFNLLSEAQQEAQLCLGTGLHFCPQCKRYYTPTFAYKRLAQVYGSNTDVEQHLSGVCSEKCWDNMFE